MKTVLEFIAAWSRVIIAGLVALVLVMAALQVRSCRNAGRDAAQGKVDKGQGEATIESGAEAMNTVSNVADADRRIEETVKGGTDEIRSRPAGRSNDAALRASCRMRSLCADRRCAALREADPRIAACRNAVGANP